MGARDLYTFSGCLMAKTREKRQSKAYLASSPGHSRDFSMLHAEKGGRPGRSGDVIGRGLGRGCASPPTQYSTL
jgi:hypothetical protein